MQLMTICRIVGSLGIKPDSLTKIFRREECLNPNRIKNEAWINYLIWSTVIKHKWALSLWRQLEDEDIDGVKAY